MLNFLFYLYILLNSFLFCTNASNSFEQNKNQFLNVINQEKAEDNSVKKNNYKKHFFENNEKFFSDIDPEDEKSPLFTIISKDFMKSFFQESSIINNFFEESAYSSYSAKYYLLYCCFKIHCCF